MDTNNYRAFNKFITTPEARRQYLNEHCALITARDARRLLGAVNGNKLKATNIEHGKFYCVNKPMRVFKKVRAFRRVISPSYPKGVVDACRVPAIANLVVPTSAVVYVPNCVIGLPYDVKLPQRVLHDAALKHVDSAVLRKCRASRASVHSIVTVKDEEFEAVAYGYSDFRYLTGTTVHPESRDGKGVFEDKSRFWERQHCTQGIHFFFDLADAIAYN